MPMSAVRVLYQDSAALPKPAKKTDNAEVASRLSVIASQHWGSQVNSENITPEIEEILVANGVEEFIAALNASGKNAADWYSTAVEAAMEVAGVIHPELSDAAAAKNIPAFSSAAAPDRAAQLVLRIALAVTSQNLSVNQNTGYAEEQYSIFKATGKFDPTRSYGEKAESISGNLSLANELIASLGFEGAEAFIKKTFEVRDLEAVASGILGRKVSVSGKKDDTVNGAALFGPKIGQGFLQNLMGFFDPVTIDLWMRRTWGRWTGDVVGDGVTDERMAKLLDAAREAGMPVPAALKTLRTVVRFRKDGKTQFKTMSASVADRLDQDPAFRSEVEKFAEEYNAAGQAEYKLTGFPVTPETAADVRSGKLSYVDLIKLQKKTQAALNRGWAALRKNKTAMAEFKQQWASAPAPAGKRAKLGAKAFWVAQQNAAAGRTEVLTNNERSDLKPAWSRAAKVIVGGLNPIDVPSPQDRRVITRVVNKIREELSNRGYSATNADVQAVLWYPEKDLWAKLRGEEESNLKQSYDDEFISIADQRGLGAEARAAAERIRTARAPRAGGQDEQRTAQANDQRADGTTGSRSLQSPASPLASAVAAAGAKGPNAGRDYQDLPRVYSRGEGLHSKALRQAKEAMPEPVRRALDGKVYIPDSRLEDLAAAENFLEAHVGAGTAIEDAAYLVDSARYGGNLTPQQKVLVKAIAAKRLQNAWAELDKAVKAGTADAGQRLLMEHYRASSYPLLQEISEKMSTTAQMLNLGNLIAKLFNPRALVPIGYKWPITKKQVEVIDRTPGGKQIVDTILGSAGEAARKTKAKVKDIVTAAGAAAAGPDAKIVERVLAQADGRAYLPVTEQVKAAVVSSEMARAEKQLADIVGDEPFLRTLAADVRRQVALQLDRQLQDYGPENQSTPPSDEELARRFRDIWDRSQLAEDAFNRVVAGLKGKSAELDAKLEGAKFDLTKDTRARDVVKQMVDFQEEVYKSLADRTATRDRIEALVMAGLPTELGQERAQKIADAIISVYDAELQEVVDRRVRSLIDQSQRAGQVLEAKTVDRLLKASNLGALTDETVYNILAPRYNLPTWNEENAYKIDTALQFVQRLPENSLQRDEAVAKVMAEIARAHREAATGLEKISHQAEVLSSFWTAGVLSGPPTHVVNATATGVSIWIENLAQSTGYFFAAKRAGVSTAEALKFYGDFGRAISNILGRGGRFFDNKIGMEFKTALNYGVSRYKSEKGETLSVLEQWQWIPNPKTMAEKWNNVLSIYKYVGRAMLAADAANSTISNDATLLMRARFEAMQTGLTGAALEKRMSEILDTRGAVREKAVAQAKEEMDRGDFEVELPFGDRGKTMPRELMLARRVEQLIERELHSEEDIAAARRFAETATFNSDAYGLVGMVADLMGQITNKIGVTKPLLPFPRTISNIVNQAINYTPYGFARAKNFSFAGVLASRYHSKSARGMEFLKYAHPTIDEFSPEYYAQLGRASVGTAGMMLLLAMAMKGLDDEKDKGERAFFEITAVGPADFAQRKQLQASGTWEPNTIRIGSVRLRYTDWPALGVVLAAVGSYSDARRYNKIDEKSAGEQFLMATMGVTSVIFEKQMLSGLSDLFKVIGGGPEGVSSAKRLASSYAGGFTNPQLVRWVRATFDSTPPEQSTVQGWLLSMTPMALGYDKPSLNLLGDPVERMFFEPTTQRFADITEAIGGVHPVLAPLSKAGVFLPVAKRTSITDPSTMQDRSMTGEEFYDYAKIYGQTVKQMVPPAMAESLARMPRDVAQKWIDDTVRPAARDAAKMLIMRRWLEGGK